MIDYTLVLGVDVKHLEQLTLVWPTWVKHKPSLLEHPIVVFVDIQDDLTYLQYTHYLDQLLSPVSPTVVPWPPVGIEYEGDDSKWNNAQRYKMLAGFVHVPGQHVTTKYWLKLDTDTIATGGDDWIDPEWFDDNPTIVCQKWHYTKPPDQIMKLDDWAHKNQLFPNTSPLNLIPESGSSLVKHPRIISWCGFFNTYETLSAAAKAYTTCGHFKLPVPSQDGYLFYHAVRSDKIVKRVDMKSRGWLHRSNKGNIMKAVKESLE